MADVDVKAKAKVVKNETTKIQDEELEKARKAKEEADQKAEEAKAEAERLKEEMAAKANSKNENVQNIALGAAALAGTALKGKSKGFLSGLITGLIIGVVVCLFLGGSFGGSIFDTVSNDQDEYYQQNIVSFTAADFKDAVVKKAVDKQNLIVMEQPLEIPTTITKAGLGNLEIFSKVKEVTYAGTGYYTVDLSRIDDEHIEVDEIRKIVTIHIPHAILDHVKIDYDKVQFEDTEKGLLAFGDIKLTAEDQNRLEQSVENSMKERLNENDLLTLADEFAVMKTWGIFQPLVSAVSAEYKVEMVFDK